MLRFLKKYTTMRKTPTQEALDDDHLCVAYLGINQPREPMWLKLPKSSDVGLAPKGPEPGHLLFRFIMVKRLKPKLFLFISLSLCWAWNIKASETSLCSINLITSKLAYLMLLSGDNPQVQMHTTELCFRS